MNTPQQLKFSREKTLLKFYFIGRNFNNALKALGFVERYHVGLRKDGLTPELHHQLRICMSIMQLKGIPDELEEQLHVAALLHDVREDYAIPNEEISKQFGSETATNVEALTKKFAGVNKNKDDYIDALALLLVSSMVKGLDRNDNLESMVGVFSLSKMLQYADEAEKLFLPMLKKASKLFTEYTLTYQAIIERMKRNIKFARDYAEALLAAQRETSQAKSGQLLAETATLKAKAELKKIQETVEAESQAIEQKVKHLDSIADSVQVHLNELEELRKENTKLKELVSSGDEKIINFKAYQALVAAFKQLDWGTRTKVKLLGDVATNLHISTLQLYEYNENKVSGNINDM